MAKKTKEEIIVNGIPVSLFILDSGDVEIDNIWVDFNLEYAKIPALGDCLQALYKKAGEIAEEKGFCFSESTYWKDLTTIRFTYTKIDWNA